MGAASRGTPPLTTPAEPIGPQQAVSLAGDLSTRPAGAASAARKSRRKPLITFKTGSELATPGAAYPRAGACPRPASRDR